MKKLIFLLIPLFALSCSSETENKETGKEAVQTEENAPCKALKVEMKTTLDAVAKKSLSRM